MTICVNVKTRDGIVLGTDSMSQVIISGRNEQGEEFAGVAKTYSHARKLFQIGKLPIGVTTFGAGNIGTRTISGLVLEFGSSARSDQVKSLAEELFEFIGRFYSGAFGELPREKQPVLGMYIGGYTGTSPLPEEWEFRLPIDESVLAVRPAENFGASWRGIDIPFTRLHFGYDPRLRQALMQLGIKDEVISRVLAGFETPVAFDAMPIQDTINFAVYVLRTTIGFTTFEFGPPACGGPLQIAAITKEIGFEWVRQPKLEIQEDFNG